MWVAEQHSDFIATIEQVNLFVVTGPSGDVIGSYLHLSEAQHAIEHPTHAEGHHHRHRLATHATIWAAAKWVLFGVVPLTGLSIAGGLLVTGVGL